MKIVLLTPLYLLLALVFIVICLHFWSTNLTPIGPGRWSTESPDGRFIITGYSNKGLRAWILAMAGDMGRGSSFSGTEKRSRIDNLKE
jgi:hypothetical protein